MSEVAKQVAQEVTSGFLYSASDAIRNALVLGLGGLGITLAINEFIGGILLAMAASAVARMRDRRRGGGMALWSALTACVLAVFAAGIIGWMEWSFPAPLAMGAVGYFSRNIVNLLSSAGDRVEERGVELTDRVVDRIVPGDDK